MEEPAIALSRSPIITAITRNPSHSVSERREGPKETIIRSQSLKTPLAASSYSNLITSSTEADSPKTPDARDRSSVRSTRITEIPSLLLAGVIGSKSEDKEDDGIAYGLMSIRNAPPESESFERL